MQHIIMDDILNQLHEISQETLVAFFSIAIKVHWKKADLFLRLAQIYDPTLSIFLKICNQVNIGGDMLIECRKSIEKPETKQHLHDYFITKMVQSSKNTEAIKCAIDDDVDGLRGQISVSEFQINYQETIFYFDTRLVMTLLSISAFYGSVQCFKFLLVNDAQGVVTERSYNKQPLSPLQAAVCGGNEEIVQLLVENHEDNSDVIRYAFQFHHFNLLLWLIEQTHITERSIENNKYDFETTLALADYRSILYWIDNNLPTAFDEIGDDRHVCILEKTLQPDLIQFLLEHGLLSLKQHTKNVCIMNSCFEALKIEEQYGFAASKYSHDYLETAIESNSYEIAEYIWNQGYQKIFDNFLENSITKGKRASIQFLLDHNVNVNRYFRETPLVSAIHFSDLELVRKLLEMGADPNLMATDLTGPLHAVSIYPKQNHIEIAQLLLQYKADINIKNKARGWTPLIMAVNWRRPDIARFLLENGADPNICANNQLTAIELCRDPSVAPYMPGIEQLLIDHGANPNPSPQIKKNARKTKQPPDSEPKSKCLVN